MPKINFSASNIESKDNKITSLTAGSTDSTYPSTKAVYDYVNNTVNTVNEDLQVRIEQRPLVGDYIVSRHSNANWDWVIYSSGWCECYGFIYINATIDDPWGNIYEGDGYSLSYPVTFRTVPYELAQANLSCGSFTESFIRNTTTRSSTYYPLRPSTGVGGDGYIYLRVAGHLA